MPEPIRSWRLCKTHLFGGLRSVNRESPAFRHGECQPTTVEKIARLGYGLASNHAFVDGNKRIGAMMMQLLLKWNGFQMSLRSGELADMFIAIADGSAKESDLLAWIQRHLE